MKENFASLVIVLSRNYSTGLGIIRSLGAAGYQVDLIASVKKSGSSVIASSSKYVNRCIEVLSPDIQKDNGSGLLEVLDTYVGKYDQKPVLFPADDFTASVVFSNKEKLERHFYMPEISGIEASDIMSKIFQGKLAGEAGLLTPTEWVISLEGAVRIPEDMVYPCFVKPLQSIAGSKNEMKACSCREELEVHLAKMQKNSAKRSVLVQEYLKIEKEYDLSGLCLKDQVIIPGIIEKQRISRHENGVTMVGKMLPPETIGTIMEQIKELMRMFHYAGMFDMELNVCGDKIYFNEINFRSGGPNYSYYLSGVNLPEIFVKWITGEELQPEEPKIRTFGKTFLYEKVAWEDYIYSHMSKKELENCLKEADHTLLADANDPKPGEIFNKRIRLSAAKQRVKRILGK